MKREITKTIGMLLILLCLSGCETYQARIHADSLRGQEIDKGGTIAILSTLPDHASIIPKRHVATDSWHINRHIEHWIHVRLKRNPRFRVIRLSGTWVRAHWKPSDEHAEFGLQTSNEKVEPIRIEPLVPSIGTRLVLVVGPRYIHGAIPLPPGGVLAPGWLTVEIIGQLLWTRRGLHGEGLGYGVFQSRFLDERDAYNYVFLYMWLFNGKSGSLIASTECRDRSTRLDDANRGNPKVKKLWIHRRGPISFQNWADTKMQIMTLTKKAVTQCLHKLSL
ncbi:MAG: hypothetical protein ACYCS1_10525 [Gammaproteobacteria bacterium]